MSDAIPTPAEYGDDMAEIARQGGPEAIGLIARLMESSARERESIEASVLQGTERQRDYWKERALYAEAELAAVRSSVSGLLYPSPKVIERYVCDE